MGARGTREWRRAGAGAAAAVAVAVAVACGTGDATDAPSSDADAAASSDAGTGADVDAMAPRADANAGPATLLVKGDISLIGVTRDGYVVYRLFDVVTGKYSLWAMEVAGGTPIELSADLGGSNFIGRVVNSGVGFWTGVDDMLLGTFNVWTKASGLKSVPGRRSFANFFTIPPGGTTVLFGSGVSDGGVVDGGVVNIVIAVAPLANLNAAAFFDDVNVAAISRNCPIRTLTPNDGNSIFMSHCTGVDPDAVVGRVALAKRLADGGVTSSVFLSEKNGATATYPFFGVSSDASGSKLFAVAAMPAGQGRIVDIATGTTTVLDPNVTSGYLTPDSGTVYYRTNGALKRAATDGGAKVTLVDGGFDHLIGVSDDERRLLFSTVPGLSDLRLVETTTGKPVTTLVPDASVGAADFSASGDDVLYVLFDPVASVADCYFGRADGSGARQVAASVAACGRMEETNVAVIGRNSRLLGPFVVLDVQTLDLSNPAAVPVDFETDVEQLTNAFQRRVAFVKRGVESGLYTRALP
jgi:hypothetical protein